MGAEGYGTIPTRRRPYELSAMLRIHQLFYNLSDPGIALRGGFGERFVGLRLSGPLPETTILFRLLEERQLGDLMKEIPSPGIPRAACGRGPSRIIEARRRRRMAGERDPQMRQTKKGNEWRFGMKVPSGWTQRREWCIARIRQCASDRGAPAVAEERSGCGEMRTPMRPGRPNSWE